MKRLIPFHTFSERLNESSLGDRCYDRLSQSGKDGLNSLLNAVQGEEFVQGSIGKNKDYFSFYDMEEIEAKDISQEAKDWTKKENERKQRFKDVFRENPTVMCKLSNMSEQEYKKLTELLLALYKDIEGYDPEVKKKRDLGFFDQIRVALNVVDALQDDPKYRDQLDEILLLFKQKGVSGNDLLDIMESAIDNEIQGGGGMNWAKKTAVMSVARSVLGS